MSKSSKKKSPHSSEKGKAGSLTESKPVVAVSTTPVKPMTIPVKSALVPDVDISADSRDFKLVRFDKRVKITLGVFFGIFLLFVLLKWHYVSVPIWNTILPDGSLPNKGLVAGTARQIRMDDYAVGAPWILSSVNNGFVVENEAIGGLKSALLTTPTHHIINIFRPAYWGFLLLDNERGYAWMYDLTVLAILAASFLTFLILTKNKFYLSLTGSIALALSSGSTAWSFIPSGVGWYPFAVFVAFIFLLHEKRIPFIILQSLLLIWSLISFVLILYPPYQIPLVYLFILLVIGYIIQERKQLFPIRAFWLKLIALAGSGLIAVLIGYTYYTDIQETIKAVTNTVYPGKRSETGGTGFIANWYSEYYSWFFSDQKFPKSWLNSCELSHYLTFAPVIIPLSVVSFINRKQINWVLAGAILFTLIMLIWVEVGFPASIAKASLFSMVPTRRAQIPMGIGSIVLTIIYLNTVQEYYRPVSMSVNIIALAAIVCFVIYTAYVNINDAEGMLKGYQMVLPILFFSAMNGLLLFTLPYKYKTTIFCTGLILFLLPNLKGNPLSKGLSPITDHALYKTIRPLVEQDPEARWVVNGSQFITYMVTATGAKQITGVKYIPDRKHIFSVLDPAAKRDSAYNRYAHVTYQSYIDGRDSVILVNQFEDGYVIAMDPCSPKMKQLNVKYQLFDHQPQPAEIRCMTLLTTLGNVQLYKVN